MEMSATTVIGRSCDDVYEFVADPSNDVQWRTGATESGWISDPPLGLGSEGYLRAGKTVTEWRVVAIEPGSSVDWELVEGPFGGSGGYRLEPVDGVTRFTLVADVEPTGVYRLIGPLFGRIGRKQNQADVDRLKSLLEAKAT